jgi:hypothetical protein
MLEIRNKTPFPTAIVPGLDKEGRDTATVVVKGTFDLGRRGAIAPSEQQAPIRHADAFHGDPGVSSVKHEGDACPAKKGTDVVLVGHASSIRPVPSIDVSLSAGALRKVVRVYGDRVWYRGLGGVAVADPRPFTRMPLVYERAFGGGDLAVDDAASRPRDPRNPLGIGFTSAAEPERIEGVRLPNLEDPDALIATPADRPPPAGFGFIGRHWLPRSSFAGTYDDKWRAERFPFLPTDFDERFFNGAPASLVSPRPFKGGESVHVANASEAGELWFKVPSVGLEIAVSMKGAVGTHAPVLDTLVIEPDDKRVLVTWRATVPCPRAFLFIEWVRVSERKAA